MIYRVKIEYPIGEITYKMKEQLLNDLQQSDVIEYFIANHNYILQRKSFKREEYVPYMKMLHSILELIFDEVYKPKLLKDIEEKKLALSILGDFEYNFLRYD